MPVVPRGKPCPRNTLVPVKRLGICLCLNPSSSFLGGALSFVYLDLQFLLYWQKQNHLHLSVVLDTFSSEDGQEDHPADPRRGTVVATTGLELRDLTCGDSIKAPCT